MVLLTKVIRKKLPVIGATAGENDPMVICKFFMPDGCFTWYVMEYDGNDIFYGYVEGLENEFGCFTLPDLHSIRGRLHLAVERDRYFKPCRLSRITKGGNSV